MDRYQKIEKNGGGNLGEGTYGVVYKAKDRQTEEIVALKVQQLERIGPFIFFLYGICVMVMLFRSKHFALLPSGKARAGERSYLREALVFLSFESHILQALYNGYGIKSQITR